MDIVFVNKWIAAAIVGLDPDTLKTWRENEALGKHPSLVLGIHWVAPHSRLVLYNRALLIDFIANSNAPGLHEIAIQNYLASLPSSQPPGNVKSNRKTTA